MARITHRDIEAAQLIHETQVDIFEGSRVGAIAVQQRSPEEQKAFFEHFIYRGATSFCDAVTASNKANFYRAVARFARAFLDIENVAFQMVD